MGNGGSYWILLKVVLVLCGLEKLFVSRDSLDKEFSARTPQKQAESKREICKIHYFGGGGVVPSLSLFFM